MACYGDFNHDPADHVYVSGYGFVSNGDPMHFGERDLRRNAGIIGICLLLLLTLPLFFWRFAEIFSSMLATFFATVFGPRSLAAANELMTETREGTLYLAAFLPTYFILRSALQPPKQTATPSPGSLRKSNLCAILVSAGVSALVISGISMQQDILSVFHLVELNPGSPPPSTPPVVILYIIRTVCFPAVFEELLFRGVILQSLRRHGDTFALFFSAFCGGLIHYSLTGDLSAFVLGLVFGYFFLRTGSIRTSIICHLAAGALPLINEGMQHLLPSVERQTGVTALLLLTLAAGLVGFTLFCRWNHNAFALGDQQGSLMPFRQKIWICLKNGPMAIAAILWLAQVLRNLQVIS